jgi:hypothetical protein
MKGYNRQYKQGAYSAERLEDTDTAYARVHPVDDARVEEIREQMLQRRSALERDGDDYCIGSSALDDIDYLLSLLPQFSSSERRCGECGHSGSLKNGICQEIVRLEPVTNAQLDAMHQEFRNEAGVIRCSCKCVFPATNAPDYERGYVEGYKVGAQLATRAILADVSRAEVVEAITDMQEGQYSHQQWLKHLSNPERDDCKGCDDHAAHIGDVEHHRQWIEKYNRVIRLLAQVPLSEIATTRAGEGEHRPPEHDWQWYDRNLRATGYTDLANRMLAEFNPQRFASVPAATPVINDLINANQPLAPEIQRALNEDFGELYTATPVEAEQETVKLTPWTSADGRVWERYANVTCVECPDCCFRFDAAHQDGDTLGYSCPNCNGNPPSIVTSGEAAREAAREIAQWLGLTGYVDGEAINEVAAIISKHCAAEAGEVWRPSGLNAPQRLGHQEDDSMTKNYDGFRAGMLRATEMARDEFKRAPDAAKGENCVWMGGYESACDHLSVVFAQAAVIDCVRAAGAQPDWQYHISLLLPDAVEDQVLLKLYQIVEHELREARANTINKYIEKLSSLPALPFDATLYIRRDDAVAAVESLTENRLQESC